MEGRALKQTAKALFSRLKQASGRQRGVSRASDERLQSQEPLLEAFDRTLEVGRTPQWKDTRNLPKMRRHRHSLIAANKLQRLNRWLQQNERGWR